MADNRHVSPLAAAGGYDIPRIIIYGSGGYSLWSRMTCDTAGGRGHYARWSPISTILLAAKALITTAPRLFSSDEWREKFLDLPVFVGVAGPKAKRLLAERVTAAGGRFARLFDSPTSLFPLSPWATRRGLGL